MIDQDLRDVVNKHSKVIKQLANLVNDLNTSVKELESDPSVLGRDVRKERMGNFMDGFIHGLSKENK